MISLNKAKIRIASREKRRNIDASTRASAAQAAKKHFMAHSLFANSQHVACYMASEEEFDCFPIIKAIWEAGKTCYLPRISEVSSRLEMVPYYPQAELVSNQYRILEPKKNFIADFILSSISIEQLDLVILPLVAFDRDGNRVGMGGGYYDRTFAGHKKNTPFLLGLGYACQGVPYSLEIKDKWDVKLDGILTEKDIFVY